MHTIKNNIIIIITLVLTGHFIAFPCWSATNDAHKRTADQLEMERRMQQLEEQEKRMQELMAFEEVLRNRNLLIAPFKKKVTSPAASCDGTTNGMRIRSTRVLSFGRD